MFRTLRTFRTFRLFRTFRILRLFRPFRLPPTLNKRMFGLGEGEGDVAVDDGE